MRGLVQPALGGMTDATGRMDMCDTPLEASAKSRNGVSAGPWFAVPAGT